MTVTKMDHTIYGIKQSYGIKQNLQKHASINGSIPSEVAYNHTPLLVIFCPLNAEERYGSN